MANPLPCSTQVWLKPHQSYILLGSRLPLITFPCLSMTPWLKSLLRIYWFFSTLAIAPGSKSLLVFNCLYVRRNSYLLVFSCTSSAFTSSISARLRFFFDEPFNKCAAFPLEATWIIDRKVLTWEAVTPAQGLSKFRAHFNQLILGLFKLLLPRNDCSIDHVLYPFLLHGVQNITDPLLIQVVPVVFIWKASHEQWLGTCKGKKVFNCETIYLWHCSNFHTWALNVLQSSWRGSAYFLLRACDLLEEEHVDGIYLGQVCFALLGQEVIDILLRLHLLHELADVNLFHSLLCCGRLHLEY